MAPATQTRRSRRKPVNGFAVVHSEEKPWVSNPKYKAWLKRLRRHTQKVKRHGENESPENMCMDSDLCKGDLGIPRKLMPQFNSAADIKNFTTFIRREFDVDSTRGYRRAGQLRPSQEEINRERVEDVHEDIVDKKLDPKVPLVISADNYVIDGHHRWAAYKAHHPHVKMPVLIVGASARDTLGMAATWGAEHQAF